MPTCPTNRPAPRLGPYHLRCAASDEPIPRKEDPTNPRQHLNNVVDFAEDAQYERYPAGPRIPIALPNSKVVVEVVDARCVLKTNALRAVHDPYSHCAHYYFHGACDLGAECNFIHMVLTACGVAPLRSTSKADSKSPTAASLLPVLMPKTTVTPLMGNAEHFIASLCSKGSVTAVNQLEATQVSCGRPDESKVLDHAGSPSISLTDSPTAIPNRDLHLSPSAQPSAALPKRPRMWYRDPYTARHVFV